MNATVFVFTLAAVVVSLTFAQEYACEDMDYNINLMTNCGDDSCQCEGVTARCRGNISTVIIPEVWANITDLYIECYNLSFLTRESFVKIDGLNLKNITLRQNHMGNTSKDIFSKFGNLTSIDIGNDGNIDITSLAIALGSVQKRLPHSLALERIELENISESYFRHLNKSNVKYLSLKGNKIQEINLTVLYSLTSLVKLDLSENWIKEITASHTSTNLRDLDLSNNHLTNNISFCIENSNASFFQNLKSLLLVKNRIETIRKEFSKNWDCLKRLELLDLSGNSIRVLDSSFISNLHSLKSLKLTKNWINYVVPGNYPHKLQSINFQNNEFVVFPPKLCGDSNTTFPSIRELNFSRNYIQRIILTEWTCLTGIKVLDFSRNDAQEFKNNTFVNFTTLTHLYLDNMVPWVKIIEPAAFNIPSLEHLSIRFNMIDFRKPEIIDVFCLCPNVKWLDVSYNIFRNMTESSIVKILTPLTELEVLNAQRIGLTQMPSEIILHFKKLQHLNINRNLLSGMKFPESFNNKSLQLAIRYISAAEGDINTIENSSFPSSILNSLKELDISDNEFACTCKMLWFRDNIKDGKIGNITLLKWPNMYKCRSPPKLDDKPFQNYKPDEECVPMKPINPLTVAFIAVGCSLFVFSTIFVTVYWNRWYVQYYWYKLSRRRKEEKSMNREIEPLLRQTRYDGYVVYNSADGSFVHSKFRDFMENHLGYKLHIWERNAECGAIVDVILDAMYASKHVIVIVSDNLMKDQWCKFQVDVAIDRSIDLGKTYVTLVVLEEVNVKMISKAWCVLLTKTPTAQWCSCAEANDIKIKYLEQKIKRQLGKPLKEEHDTDE